MSNGEHQILAYLNDLLTEPVDVPLQPISPMNSFPLKEKSLPDTLIAEPEHINLALSELQKQRLQTLLDEPAPLSTPPLIANPFPVSKSVIPKSAPVITRPIIEAPTQVEPAVMMPVTVVAPATVVTPSVIKSTAPILATEPIQPITPAPEQTAYPDWAGERFDVLKFRVMDVNMAAPLILLGQVYSLNNRLNIMLGQPAWMMGVLTTPAGKINVVNTALLVMPEKCEDQSPCPPQFVISLHGQPWGLAVEAVYESQNLNTQDIQWRRRITRPWLAGILKDSMSILLDLKALTAQLNEAVHN